MGLLNEVALAIEDLSLMVEVLFDWAVKVSSTKTRVLLGRKG